MKKIVVFLTLVLVVGAAFAQKGKVTSAQNLKETGKLKEAFEAIETAIDPSNDKAEKSIPWAKTWEVRGEVYQAIFQSADESIKKLNDDPLTVALESYKKALALDEKNKLDKSVKIKLTLLTNDLTTQAISAFEVENYAKALTSFEQILEINETPIIKEDNPDAVDTVILFNAGLAAYNAENFDKAIKYYKQAAEHGYNEGRTYVLISNAYLQQKDTLNAIETLKNGFEKYPSDNTLLNNMIQIYMDLDKTDEALKYLNMAIEQDPKNVTYYFAQGVLFEKLFEEQKAIESYKKSIEVDDKFFDGYYNLGALYYNKGVKQIEVATAVPPNENERYIAETKKADQWWEKALPYMEKCNELQPDDPNTLESLKNLYYRMKQMDKYNAVLEKLGQ